MSNMYEKVKTINPLGGACLHDCKYCSTKTFKNRLPALKKKYSGKPHLDQKVLDRSLGKNNTWFICGATDLFAENVPAKFIIKILEWILKYPDNEYILQTKNPKRFYDFQGWFTDNMILATTIETDNPFIIQHISKAPFPANRALWMVKLPSFIRKMVTIEPIMSFTISGMINLIKQIEPEVVYIGANSKGHNLSEPPAKDIRELISELKKFTKIIQKPNLKRLL